MRVGVCARVRERNMHVRVHVFMLVCVHVCVCGSVFCAAGHPGTA